MRILFGLILFFEIVGRPLHAQEKSFLVETKDIEVSPEAKKSIAPLQVKRVIQLHAEEAFFGGFSGMRLHPENDEFIAISDSGHAWVGKFGFNDKGVLKTLDESAFFPLPGPEGIQLGNKSLADSEAVTWSKDQKSLLISFEYRHRVWKYDLANTSIKSISKSQPVALGAAPFLARLPANGGIEAMATLSDGSLLLLSEQGEGYRNGKGAWHFNAGKAFPLNYLNPGPYVPTDAARLNEGKILVLNRHYSPLAGVSAVLTIIDAPVSANRPLQILKPRHLVQLKAPFPTDNYEALTVRRRKDGWDVFILSDDNFNAVQKTLLLHLYLEEKDVL